MMLSNPKNTRPSIPPSYPKKHCVGLTPKYSMPNLQNHRAKTKQVLPIIHAFTAKKCKNCQHPRAKRLSFEVDQM